MTEPTEGARRELWKVLQAIHAPGVVLPPWRVDTRPGGDGSARKNSIGIEGGCVIEHDHSGDDVSEACVVTEFAVVWNNDCRRPATHPDNARQVATAKAMVAAFNFLARYGDQLL